MESLRGDQDRGFQAPSNETMEPAEEEKPAKKIKSVSSGMIFYTKDMLVRVSDGRFGLISGWEMVEDWPKSKADYTHDDPSIRRVARKFVNPRFSVRIGELQEAFGPEENLPTPVYYLTYSRQEVDLPSELEHLNVIESRGHRFHLGELVSFRRAVGRLVAILPAKNPEETKVRIAAREVYGQPGSDYVWEVSASEMDYIEHDEKGAVKRNPDNTVFKPTLEKE